MLPKPFPKNTPTNKNNKSIHSVNNKQNNDSYQSQKPSLSCNFCHLKPIIMQQLSTLQAHIIEKNQRIKELQQLVQRISKMACISTNQHEDRYRYEQQLEQRQSNQIDRYKDMNSQNNYNQNSYNDDHDENQQYVQQLTFSQNVQYDSIQSKNTQPQHQNHTNQINQSQLSSQKSQPVLFQKKIIKKSIKNMRIIQNNGLNKQNIISQLDQQYKRQSSRYQHIKDNKNINYNQQDSLPNNQLNKIRQQLIMKQSPLRSKLLQIINILPSKSNNNSNNSNSSQQFKTTLSQPLDQGKIGLINCKTSNHKVVKHSGFIKKSQKIQNKQGEETKNMVLINRR